jgi:hypothetical protein
MAKDYFLQFGAGDPRTFTGLAPTLLIFKNANGTNVTPPAITEVSASGIYTFSWGTTQSIAFLADAATTSPGTAGRYIVGSLDPADRIDEVGTTLVAIGTTVVAGQVNFGSTLVAIGNTAITYGNANFALGTTNVALGTTNVALGTTSVALGTSNIALGTTILQGAVNEGVTLVAIGNTLAAIGTTLTAIGTSNAFALLVLGTTASAIGDSSTSPGDLFGYMKRVRDVLEGQERFVKSSGALTMYDRTGATTLASRTITNNASLVVKT